MSERSYEAMFILNNNAANADWDATSGAVDALLKKHGATIAKSEKWDERKLAYEIKGQRRATYYLVYFMTAPTSLDAINEDLRLMENVLRYMFLALDQSIEDHIRIREEERERLAEDSRRNSLGGWGDSRRNRRGRDRRSIRSKEGEGDAAKPGEVKSGEAESSEATSAESKAGSAATAVATPPAAPATEAATPASKPPAADE